MRDGRHAIARVPELTTHLPTNLYGTHYSAYSCTNIAICHCDSTVTGTYLHSGQYNASVLYCMCTRRVLCSRSHDLKCCTQI